MAGHRSATASHGARSDPPSLPDHVEQTVRHIAKLHADHRDRASPAERAVERVVAGLANAKSLAALARHREQMTLELAMLSEQKLAKIIELLEESRRDNPLLSNRLDAAAAAMSEPADPATLGEAIKRNDE